MARLSFAKKVIKMARFSHFDLHFFYFCNKIKIMRKESFKNNGIYHIYNRGVDERDIFLNEDDFRRFLDFAKVYRYKNLRLRSLGKKKSTKRSLANLDQAIKPMVEILAYVLVKNHFHIILRQLAKDGITKFMHKLGSLYTLWFNEKHTRTGRLFEGSFKAISVPEDTYLFYLSFYIHLHPAEFITPKLKGGKIRNRDEIIIVMEEYRWSSYPVYLEKRKDELLNTKFILDYFKRPNSNSIEEYKKFIEGGLDEGDKRFKEIEGLLLD